MQDEKENNSFYKSPSLKNAITPTKKALIQCDNKLSVFLAQLNVDIKNRNKKSGFTRKENNKNFEDVCKGIENIKF